MKTVKNLSLLIFFLIISCISYGQKIDNKSDYDEVYFKELNRDYDYKAEKVSTSKIASNANIIFENSAIRLIEISSNTNEDSTLKTADFKNFTTKKALNNLENAIENFVFEIHKIVKADANSVNFQKDKVATKKYILMYLEK